MNRPDYSYLRHAFGCTRTYFPASRFESFEDFVKKAMRECSHDSSRTRQMAGNVRQLGTCCPSRYPTYQHEFMRAVSEGLGLRSGVLCEWTATTHGHVDFYIPTMRWAVIRCETVRETTPGLSDAKQTEPDRPNSVRTIYYSTLSVRIRESRPSARPPVHGSPRTDW